jgi:hypothetical protein
VGFKVGKSTTDQIHTLKQILGSGIERGTILYKSTQLLGYADDIDIIGNSEKAIIEAFVKPEKAAQQIGLKINEDKTKYIEVTSNHTGRTLPTNNRPNYKF